MRPINFNPAENNSFRPTHFIPLKSLPFKKCCAKPSSYFCPDLTTENPNLNFGQNVTIFVYVHTSDT